MSAPVTKRLGDVLYADTSKSRVSEDEWLQLVRAVASGDQHALYSLYEQTHRIVFTLIVRITMNRETAEEVTLDVFHEVWRRASSYDPSNGTVMGWILNQARSRAFDRVRFDHRKERHIMLRNAMQNLSDEERQVVESAFFADLTHQEVAEKLNQPLGTVKT